jgi:hypothetical protein
VRYKPGSFSKNFAWGTGLGKLHRAIRLGFGGKTKPIERLEFRENSQIADRDLQLIPIKFFLFNRSEEGKATIQVDELVFQAVENPHSIIFDRLAVFALHLSSVGDIESGGTPWLRDFVMQRLWTDGFWVKARLEKTELDLAFAQLLDAKPEVRIKCRSNYRYIMDTAGFVGGQGEFIDNREGHWLSPAIILAWDRAILSGTLPQGSGISVLTEYIRTGSIYMLLGVPEEFAIEYAAKLAPSYAAFGDVRRFGQDARPLEAIPSVVAEISKLKQTKRRTLEEIARQINTSEVVRVKRVVQQQLRDAQLSAILKALYDSQCMFCDARIHISISPDKFYAEAAHIRPLGWPANGPDRSENMLVLCPNCHVQFDSGILTVCLSSPTEFTIKSKIVKHPLNGRIVKTREGHRLIEDYCIWHESNWAKTRR